MTALAYIDVRPFLFLAGLPLFILLPLLVCRMARAKAKKVKVALIASLVFTGLFAIFLTGFGPFVDQKETREYSMTWEVKPASSDEMKEPEVILSFVDFPGHFIGEHSHELAGHLRAKGEAEVKVGFEVTSDYGKVRGFHATEIAGLKSWRSEWGHAGAIGSPDKSPWD